VSSEQLAPAAAAAAAVAKVARTDTAIMSSQLLAISEQQAPAAAAAARVETTDTAIVSMVSQSMQQMNTHVVQQLVMFKHKRDYASKQNCADSEINTAQQTQ
jgi:hypothetical protein